MKARPRKRPRPSRFLNGIDFWAFLSIEVVLLVIFMVHVPPNPYHGAPIDLAAVDHARPMRGALRKDAMLVAVTRDGNLFHGTQQIQSGDVSLAIQDAVRPCSERKVYLKVDSRAKYGDAAVVIDQGRRAGIENIGIIAAQRMPTSR